jgi:hypothetical protein
VTWVAPFVTLLSSATLLGVSIYKRCVEPSLSCDTVSILNVMCRHSPFGECDAVGISSLDAPKLGR